jgi:late competence protein required for DNA uptake (superfamily II DNA/RNA helicase)
MLHAFINKTSRNENAKIPCIICYGCRNCVICGLRVASQDASATAVVHHKAAVVVHHKGKTSVHQVVVDPQVTITGIV